MNSKLWSWMLLLSMLLVLALPGLAQETAAPATATSEIEASAPSPTPKATQAVLDQRPLQAGMDTFERFYQLYSNEWTEPAVPYEREILEPDWEKVFYEPTSKLILNAGLGGEPGELPYYIIAAKENRSMPHNEMWPIMATFLQAVNPALTDHAAWELMCEILYGRFSADESIEMSISYYGPWRLTLSILSAEEADGPTLFMMPEKEPIQEPVNGSVLRIMSVQNRFGQLTEASGFPVRMDVPRERIDDVMGHQVVQEVLDQVWWMDMFYENLYLGSGVNVAKASEHYARYPELAFSALFAAFPYLEVEEAQALYAELEAGFLTTTEPPETGFTLNYDGYVLNIAEREQQRAVIIISPYGNLLDP